MINSDSKKVDAFISKQSEWQEALTKFRAILQATEMEETLKWGIPVYALKGKNVVGLSAFKSYVGLWFYQGVFLKDPKKVLVNAQEGKTKAMRQLRFTSETDIDYEMVKIYIEEAVQNQKEGKEMKADLKKPLIIPEELESALTDDSVLKSHFEKLSPGKQREFADYISEAKQHATRLNRLEKITTMILKGVGLNDKYKK